MRIERVRLGSRRRSKATRETTSPGQIGGSGRVRVWLRSPDYRLIDQACVRLVSTVERLGAAAEGPTPMPTEEDDRKTRIHVRRIDIIATNRDFLETLATLDLPAGVSISMAG
ncbi:MAG TPA: 30S ribosomal protein S10 [Chloroflexota bacterium]|nr:30S ribosomal protein S10 [Chloroflexota bacterium]